MISTGCILVVDDEPQIRRALKNALREVADRVIEAASGAEGIDLAATEQPDMVVLDLGLPDLSGADVCRDPPVGLDAGGASQRRLLVLGFKGHQHTRDRVLYERLP